MYIFVDESGSFAVPEKIDKPSISLVAALVVPEDTLFTLCRTVSNIARYFGVNHRELKGRNLDEDQFKYFIEAISPLDVTFHVSCIDLALHSQAGITKHKVDQAEKFLVDIENALPGMQADLRDFYQRLRNLSNPLYVQSVLMTDLADMVFRTTTLYYCLRKPHTMGDFRWRIDAKSRRQKTEYENLWMKFVLPAMQGMSLKKASDTLIEGDYSHMKRFEIKRETVPEHLAAAIKDVGQGFSGWDLRMIMSDDMRFIDSEKSRCLQAIDVLSNGIRRAMVGNLGESGWGSMGKLMIQPANGNPAMRCVALNASSLPVPQSVPYNYVFRRVYQDVKPMLPKTLP